MFRIRQAQLEIIQQGRVRRFESEVMSYLKANHPEVVAEWTEDQLRDQVHQGLEKAEAAGRRTDLERREYVCSFLLLGEGFESRTFSLGNP